jgi:hypothetical protein
MKQSLQKLISKELSVRESAEFLNVPNRSLQNRLKMIRSEAKLKQKPGRSENTFLRLKHNWSVTLKNETALQSPGQ